MTSTAVTTNAAYSYEEAVEGWLAYIDGGDYTDSETAALIFTLVHEQSREVDARLPEGWWWDPRTSSVNRRITAPDTGYVDLIGVFTDAVDAVVARFESIEAAAMEKVTAFVRPNSPLDGVRLVETNR